MKDIVKRMKREKINQVIEFVEDVFDKKIVKMY